MTQSVFAWTIAAVLLFWTVGAYNRLMRLRADAKSAFEAVDAEITRQIELVRRELPLPDATQPAPLHGDASSFSAGLHAAAGQFAATLGAVRNKPLDSERMAALAAAQNVLVTAWERAERDDAHNLAGPQLPEAVLVRRGQLALQTHGAIEQFNQAVARYNAAIRQFPPVVLAWIFGFRPAGALPHVNGASVG